MVGGTINGPDPQLPPKPAAKPLTARIEVFRPGTFTPMDGVAITYSAADLKAVADAYDPATAPAPIVIGHPAADAPAFGWVELFFYDGQAGRLVAELHEIEPAFADMVKAGRFKKVSMSFFAPGTPHNPVPHPVPDQAFAARAQTIAAREARRGRDPADRRSRP